MSVSLGDKAVQLRSQGGKIGDLLASAIEMANQELDALGKALSTLTFIAAQNGALSIDALAIRSLTKRFTFEDAAPIQALAAAGNQIIPTGEVIRLTNISGGALTLTSTPTIAAGKNLQSIKLVNISANNFVFQDRGTLANSGLALGAATRTLKTRCMLRLTYSTDLALWLEDYFSNNL